MLYFAADMSMNNNVKKILTIREFQALSAFRSQLEQEIADVVHGMILFGSRARGEGNEDSDVDVLVLLNEEDHTTKIKIWDIAYRVFAETDILISPLVMSADQFETLLTHERLIAITIKKEGVEL